MHVEIKGQTIVGSQFSPSNMYVPRTKMQIHQAWCWWQVAWPFGPSPRPLNLGTLLIFPQHSKGKMARPTFLAGGGGGSYNSQFKFSIIRPPITGQTLLEGKVRRSWAKQPNFFQVLQKHPTPTEWAQRTARHKLQPFLNKLETAWLTTNQFRCAQVSSFTFNIINLKILICKQAFKCPMLICFKTSYGTNDILENYQVDKMEHWCPKFLTVNFCLFRATVHVMCFEICQDQLHRGKGFQEPKGANPTLT